MTNKTLLSWEDVIYRAAMRSQTNERFDFFRLWWAAVAAEANRRGIRWYV